MAKKKKEGLLWKFMLRNPQEGLTWKFLLRTPESMRRKIESAAKAHKISVNAEILLRLQESFDERKVDDATRKATDEATRKLIAAAVEDAIIGALDRLGIIINQTEEKA
jgi:Arc-like DNA binding domain